MRALNPVLMPDGDIVYNTATPRSPRVRQSACGKIVWVREGDFDHSNEPDAEGNIWGPARYSNPFPNDGFLNVNLNDNALAETSPGGKTDSPRFLFPDSLLANGLRALLLGPQQPETIRFT